MSFYSTPVNFGMASIIDQLTRLQNSRSVQPLSSRQPDQPSFTFQHLPKESDRIKINKDVYLNNDSSCFYHKHPKPIKQISFEEIKETVNGDISRMDFFEDIQDFHSRKEQISKIQKKYLSVLSNNSQHKRCKKRIFDKENRSNLSEIQAWQPTSKIMQEQVIVTTKKENDNWLESKRESIKNTLGGLYQAMTQCYAHIPDKEVVLNKFDSIIKRK